MMFGSDLSNMLRNNKSSILYIFNIMNPLRKERKGNNSGSSPRATYEEVFGRPGFLSFTRPVITSHASTHAPTSSYIPTPCAPQLYEPFIDNHYVAFHRKKGPIGYVGVYKGKQNCLYRFNYINDHDYDGNKYLFRQVPPRNARPGSKINNSMEDRLFTIYEKDGTKINTFRFLGRKNNVLLFEAENFSSFSNLADYYLMISLAVPGYIAYQFLYPIMIESDQLKFG